MKVLFYLLDGDTNASSWHRALQYFPLLRDHGLQPVASRPVPAPLYVRMVESGAHGGGGKAAYYGLFLAFRLADVLRASVYDVVVVQRDLFPFGPPLLERLLWRLNPRLTYDTDDATYLRPAFTPRNVFQRLRRFDKVADVVRHARWVSVATPPIADWARQHSAAVSVIPMALDLADYAAARSTRAATGDHLTIGWTGTGGSARYLAPLQPALAHMVARQDVTLRLVSGAGEAVRRALAGVTVQVVPWSAERVLADLASFDVGLLPLDDGPFERAKFPFKLLQYMALGIPTVASPVGMAAEVIRDGENGLLARTPAEWQDALSRLQADGALRRRLAAAGLATVAERYTIEKVGPLLADGLRRVGGGA